MTLLKKLYSRKGQFMPEMMVAISILVVGVLGIVTLFIRSLSLAGVVTDNYIGTYLAAEGIEVTKNILDTNLIEGNSWNDGFADGEYEVEFSSEFFIPIVGAPRPLLADSVGPGRVYWYVVGTPTQFTRKIRITLRGENEIQVNSIMEWTSRGKQFQIDVEDHFYNWQ